MTRRRGFIFIGVDTMTPEWGGFSAAIRWGIYRISTCTGMSETARSPGSIRGDSRSRFARGT